MTTVGISQGFDFLDICNAFIEHKQLYESMIKNFVGNRISLFCCDVYFKKLKIDKKKYIDINKNYGIQCLREPKILSFIKTENENIMFKSIFEGFMLSDLKEKYFDAFEEAMMEPFAYYRANMNPTVYPKNFDV